MAFFYFILDHICIQSFLVEKKIYGVLIKMHLKFYI